MRRFRLMVAGIAVAGLLLSFGTAQAADCGPGGTPPNGSGSCETTGNQVRCGPGTDTGLIIVSASASGAEICNEGGTAFPVEGRAGAQQSCQCVYIDGDHDNNHALLLHGWFRFDQSGAWCKDGRDPNGGAYSAPGRPAHQCFVG